MEHARPPAELSLSGGPASRADAWRKWLKKFQVFLKASGVYKETADVQASLLINLIGADGYDVYSTFKFSAETDREDITKLIQKFNDHFGTKINTTMIRFKFFTRNQEAGESIDEYVTALKLISQQCEFEHLEDGLLRDRIVCGVKDGTVRDRLLRTDDLTLGKAVKICQASEISNDEGRQIENVKSEVLHSVDVVRSGHGAWRGSAGPGRSGGGGGWRGRGSRRAGAGGGSSAAGGRGAGGARAVPVRPATVCAGCAGTHCDGGNKCPAKNVKCFLCNGVGHYKRMCPVRKYDKVYELQEESDDELFYISSIDAIVYGKDSKWYETIYLFDCKSNHVFKLDTGSDLNVLSKNNYIKLGLSLSDIIPDNTKAQSFCGNFINVIGSCSLNCVYKGNEYLLKFVICESDCQSILGKNALEQLNLINRVYSLNIDDYSDLFEGLGKLPGQYKIHIEADVTPCVCPVRKIPLGIRDQLQVELCRMEELGVIRKVSHPTAWVNAIVVAAKKDGSFRICLDPRPLNKVIQRQHYPLPTLTEMATKLEGARYFSKLDARSGFWMVQLHEDSADLCTFGTPFGRYQFLRLPYGINSASEVFHAKVRQLLEDLDGVDSFVDDIIVWGSTEAEHDRRLQKLLERARQVGIKFNRSKCEFRMTEVTYLGHKFNASGMRIDESKLKAVKNMPSPTDRQSLERFLGMINYLCKFIPSYSEKVTPLRNLLRKDNEWCWSECEEGVVAQLKRDVCSAPVLALFDARQPAVVSVDASAHALGAVLLQAGRPVEFASLTLTDTQQRYAQIEKELLAIVFALERFHQYIFGKKDILVETDHKPLEALFKKSLNAVPARLQRMMLRIQRYEFTVQYKPGKYMYVADALSRAPLPELMNDKVSEAVEGQTCFLLTNVRFSNEKMDLIKQYTQSDLECQLLIGYITKGWPINKYEVDERVRPLWDHRASFEFVEGVLFKDNLVFVPSGLRAEMLSRVHEGHLGIDRCKRRARDVMYWHGMSRDVEQAVRRCRVCAEHASRPQREPMIPHLIPSVPWMKVGSDIFEFNRKYFLILIDYFSNFVEVCPLSTMTSKSVITAMKDQFARHGIPQELVTDNGPAYVSKEFNSFRNNWGFRHATSSPNYPQSNGRSERTVRTIKSLLVKAASMNTDFYIGLLNYRATPRDGIASPAQLLMGRRLNTRLPSHINKLQPDRDNTKDYAGIVRNQMRSKGWHDERARALPELQAGDEVVTADGQQRRHLRVTGRALEPRSYFVTDTRGHVYRRNRRHLVKLPSHTPSPSPSPLEIVRDDGSDSDGSLYEEPPEGSLDGSDSDQSYVDRLIEMPDPQSPTAATRPKRAAALKAKAKLQQIYK